jgi:uncharacterized protein YegL
VHTNLRQRDGHRLGQPYIEQVSVTTTNRVAEVPADQADVNGPGWVPAGSFNRSFADGLINPPAPTECGINIGMVVDVSESLNSTEMNQVKNALRGAVNALVGTPTSLGMFSFATVSPGELAPANLPLTPIFANATPVLNWINQLPTITGATSDPQLTNWDDALRKVAARPEHYDVVFVVTDGFPTAWGLTGQRERKLILLSPAPVVARSATEQAVASANVLKAEGTRIVGLGVGNTNEVSVESIRPITGPTDALQTDFASLAATLAQLATENCRGSVTITKATRTGTTGPFSPTGGWTFSTPTANVTPSSGVTADDSGSTAFRVGFGAPAVARNVTFNETLQPGFNLVQQAGANAVCTTETGATVPVANSGALGFTLSVDPAAIVTCTVQNQTVPTAQLTLAKQVTNNSGGTAAPQAWTLTATGPTPISGTTGSTAVTNATVTPGTYTLSETGPAGYTASAWSCTGVTPVGNQITLASGGSATCTIANDDQPATLTLVKQVVNNNFGTAVAANWTLTAQGPATTVTGNGTVTQQVPAGTYSLSETGPAGYTASAWSCAGGTQAGASITLAIGQSATCTIVNDDQPASLTLVKTVTNNSGGTALPTAWTLTAAGPTTGIIGATGSGAVTNVPVVPGSYALSETGPPGYTAFPWTCQGGTLVGSTVTVALGQNVTCTIANDDRPATLTLVKNVVNDNGGTAVPTDWTGHSERARAPCPRRAA